MRAVSWIIVLAAVAWLGVYSFAPTLREASLPEMGVEQVAGTTARVPPVTGAVSGLEDFARNYTEAWNSRDPAAVAAFHGPDSSMVINGGEPWRGSAGISEMAAGFLGDFPDLVVHMDGLQAEGEKVVYQWTFTGTHATTHKPVRISGQELWRIGADGLIAESIGQFDAAEYERQVAEGYQP